MILSYKWLCELTGARLDPGELADRLTAVGLNIEEVGDAGYGDHYLDADITTNRPDWLCHLGVAHEIAAIGKLRVRSPEIALRETGPATATLTSVATLPEAREICPRYVARVIRGVKVGPSPDWARERLLAIGQRPINNIVDITNLVCFEMNQPLHAFDLRKLAEGRIILRRAKNGEKFAAITGEKCELDSSLLVVADAARAVALAGVKGGENTAVDENTVDVLLEAAWFQPRGVRRAARKTRMSSESSYRFERGIDPGMTERASARAAGLILEFAGGELAAGHIDTNPGLAARSAVTMRFSRCDKLLGYRVDPGETRTIFAGLGLEEVGATADSVTVLPPTFRQDLKREADLIEEVARLAGYDRIPETVTMPLLLSQVRPETRADRIARRTLAALGYHECITDSFVPADWCPPFAPSAAQYRVRNPVNAERPVLRSSLIPSLLEVRRTNRSEAEVRLFEIGNCYVKNASGPREPPRLAILDDRGMEYVRGAIEAALAALSVAGEAGVRAADAPGFAFGGGAELTLGNAHFARIGLASAEQAARFDLDAAPGLGEVEMAVVAGASEIGRAYRPPPRFPGIRRDVSLSVPEGVKWADLEKTVRGAATLLDGLEFVSLYRGKGLQAGFKGLAFAMRLRAPDRSLADEEANSVRDEVVKVCLAAFPGAAPR
ncbi:MAG: phenylalanine--tRNA ligase subunit beta [Planctomycetota bacterium]|jgi:phenylalanyl-tRNA synthetase beta chain|nr:phenylalanine--tRNA ligase subunit beta [Planctomycetota bacterium]